MTDDGNISDDDLERFILRTYLDTGSLGRETGGAVGPHVRFAGRVGHGRRSRLPADRAPSTCTAETT
jgi:hypothetical protein